MPPAVAQRELEEVCSQLDTVRLDRAVDLAVDLGALQRIIETEMCGAFLFNSVGELAAFEFAGLTERAEAEYRRSVISVDHTWGFFEPWNVPVAQRNQAVVFQTQQFLAGRAPLLRKLGLRRAEYDRVAEAFRNRIYPFYERHGLGRLWHVRSVLTAGPRLIGWIGGMAFARPRAHQLQRLAALMPSLLRRLQLVRSLDQAAPAQATLEQAIDAIDHAAYLVAANGRIVHANASGRTRLAEHDEAERIRALVMSEGSSAGFAVPRGPGAAPLRLIVDRSRRDALPGKLASRLTGRQAQVATLLCEGITNFEIANRLGIAERTVEVHATAIYARLGVATRAAAVAKLTSR